MMSGHHLTHQLVVPFAVGFDEGSVVVDDAFDQAAGLSVVGKHDRPVKIAKGVVIDGDLAEHPLGQADAVQSKAATTGTLLL